MLALLALAGPGRSVASAGVDVTAQAPASTTVVVAANQMIQLTAVATDNDPPPFAPDPYFGSPSGPVWSAAMSAAPDQVCGTITTAPYPAPPAAPNPAQTLLTASPQFDQPGSYSLTITATATYTAPDGSFTVTRSGSIVYSIMVVAVSFSPDRLALAAGKTASVTVTVLPDTASALLTFDVADPAVATVSGGAAGLTVSGVAVGQTTLSARLSPGGDVVATLPVYVVQAVFTPTSVLVAAVSDTSVAVTVTPFEAADLVTFAPADSGVAFCNGDAPAISIYGVSPGTTRVDAIVSGQACGSVDVGVVQVSLTPQTVNVVPGGTACALLAWFRLSRTSFPTFRPHPSR